MQLGTILFRNKVCPVIVIGDKLFSLNKGLPTIGWRDNPSDIKGIVSKGFEGFEVCSRLEKELENCSDLKKLCLVGTMDSASFLPPIPNPNKVLCVAGNYQGHIKEGGAPLFDKYRSNPRLFTKPASTGLIGHKKPIKIPKIWNKVDWEAELAVVIGRHGKYIREEEALEYVFGYTVFNDISCRELCLIENREERHGDLFFDWLHGKMMDTFAPMGPYLVTKDQVGNPQNLLITLDVNGERHQDSSTSDMIYSVTELISFASQIFTLEPGDVLATGTPSGVGAVKDMWLKDGDEINISIDKVGELVNHVQEEV